MKSYTQILKESTMSWRPNPRNEVTLKFTIKELENADFLKFLNGSKIFRAWSTPGLISIVFDNLSELSIRPEIGSRDDNFIKGVETNPSQMPDGRIFNVDPKVKIDNTWRGNTFIYKNIKVSRNLILLFAGIPSRDNMFEVTYKQMTKEEAKAYMDELELRYGEFSAHQKLNFITKINKLLK